MSVLRFFAVIVIFVVTSIAWTILGGTVEYRTASLSRSLSAEVDGLWGLSDLVQFAPAVVTGRQERVESFMYSDPLKSDVSVRFDHHNRYKGLMWFSTYTIQFSGTYTIRVPSEAAREGSGPTVGIFVFRLPCEVEKTQVLVDGQPAQNRYSSNFSNTLLVDLRDAEEHVITVAYEARGRDRWRYTPVWTDLSRPAGLKQFTLTAATNFKDIDYPQGSVSPVIPAVSDGEGMRASWRYDIDRTSKWFGIEMPRRQDAGPIAAHMSFFAPVSLFFFFTALFTIVVLKKIHLHPMHYLFIAAGFFAFHILLAYLVDIISIHAAFWICASVSVFLVVTYIRLVAGVKFALTYTALAQLVYLVGFSYAFFWVGKTGLTVTVGAIITLFVLMQATGRIDWREVFKRMTDRPTTDTNATVPPPLPPEPMGEPPQTQP